MNQKRSIMHRSKEEEMLCKHYRDLIDFSYQRMIPAYSNFAGVHELSLGFLALEEFYGKNRVYEGVHYQLFGGYTDSERKIFCFMNPDQVFPVEKNDFPIRCIRFSPVNKKFGENLNHRDYLGTILGLGLIRNQIGDILVEKDSVFPASSAYVFCKEDKAELLTEITRIRHTTIRAEIVDLESTTWQPSFRDLTGSISSFRLDAILSFALKLSRSQVLPLIQNGQVVVNGRICTENAKILEEGTVFSVRGYGKYIFEKNISRSKKGRYQVKIKQYI